MRLVVLQGYDAAAYAAAGYGSQAEYEAAAAAYGMAPYGNTGGTQAATAGGWGAHQAQALHGAADQKLGASATYGVSADQVGPPLAQHVASCRLARCSPCAMQWHRHFVLLARQMHACPVCPGQWT